MLDLAIFLLTYLEECECLFLFLEKTKTFDLLLILSEAYDSPTFGLRTCVVELRFILKPHHHRWRCTSSIAKESNSLV